MQWLVVFGKRFYKQRNIQLILQVIGGGKKDIHRKNDT